MVDINAITIMNTLSIVLKIWLPLMLYTKTSLASSSDTVNNVCNTVPSACSSSIVAVNDPVNTGNSSFTSVMETVRVLVAVSDADVALEETK